MENNTDNINIESQDRSSSFPQNIKNPVLTAVLGIFILVIVGVFGWYIFYSKSLIGGPDQINEVVGIDTSKELAQGSFHYIVPGVPYVGVFNHVGEVSNINNDADGAIASILEYWNPGKVNFVNIWSELAKQSLDSFIQIPHFKGYIDGLDDYVTKIERLEITELKKYINSEVKTPLLFFLPTRSQIGSEDDFLQQASVMIGVNELNQRLILHSYWSGNNTEMSFSNFEIVQKQLPQNMQNMYLVIQPKNLTSVLGELKKNENVKYPARGIIMNESIQMLRNYGIGSSALLERLFVVAERYLKEVINDPKFEEFMPPYFKVLTLYKLADAELALGKDAEAKEYAMQAIGLNHNLDTSFKDWPGYEVRYNIPATITDRISAPYRALGDIYMRLNNLVAAKEAYKNALAINARDFKASRGLRFVELRLNPETDVRVDTGIFINTLIQKSPWDTSWNLAEGVSKKFDAGTFKMSFAESFNEEIISGQFFDSSIGIQNGSLLNFVIRDNCVSFVFAISRNHYDFCLTKAGSLIGVISGFPNNNDLLADVIATPNN